ncbi:queuine tRNA-ribosyltransferase accessory subunit 2 isoform X2 [Nematostella vectensis]|uniref:queuine tRNA-ribosyltransferase accessory subunit 2 isoform X2 n=1 Tax=Nematostella vectensis TaxID=45351 RepID=UPI002076DE05|nr:queuine tRNA-ribosyltransferase accessory subunit 2 isoform X2 [Nematostella vectensis]
MHMKIEHRRGRSRTGVVKVGGKNLKTPACLAYTRAGAIPHVIQDLAENIKNLPAAMQLTLPTLTDQPPQEITSNQSNGIHTFLGLQNFVSFLTIQDPVQTPPSGYNEDNAVSVWTSGGRRKFTVQKYLAKLMVLRPTVAECLCDTIPASKQTAKRIKKSVDRTLKFLDELVASKSEVLRNCSLLGAIEGSDSLEERIRSARETATRPVSGFVLEGFNPKASSDWISLLQDTVDVLPCDKPRVIQGISSPDEVLQAVDCGVDIFDSSFPYQLAERGSALVFPSRHKRFKGDRNYTDNTTEASNINSTQSPAEMNNTEILITEETDNERHVKGIDKRRTTDFEIDLNKTRNSRCSTRKATI